MSNIREVQRWVVSQNDKRDLWVDDNDPQKIAVMVAEEAQELVEELEKAMVTDDAFSIASEIGDVGYLLLRLCDALGIDLLEAIEMKIVRNTYKYPDHIQSNGRDYQSARSVSKEAWKAMGGDSAFSHVYLDFLAHVEGE